MSETQTRGCRSTVDIDGIEHRCIVRGTHSDHNDRTVGWRDPDLTLDRDDIPTTQPSTLTWITASDVYLEPDLVLAHLRHEIESAERRATEERVPGRPVLAITACISTDPCPSALKG